MNPLVLGYPAMTAEEATERYGHVFTLKDAVPCDLPEHRYSMADEPLDGALCSVPFQLGNATGYLNFFPITK